MPDFFDAILSSQAKRICVIAAPGSGKTTRILIPKAKQLLATGTDPAEILLLTFSRLSAIDLKRKVEPFDQRPRALTVHAFCLGFLLSEDNHQIRQRVNSILLDFEKDVLLADLKHLFPQRTKPTLRKELGQFSAAWAVRPHDQLFEESAERRAFKYAVMHWLDEHCAAMMEEIVYHAVDLAQKLPDAPILDRTKYILVDEFQDLNELEQRFIELLSTKSAQLVVVGDPDQSIYSFKYAHPTGIVDFAQRADVEHHDSLVTGRCPKNIIRLAAQLLSQGSPGRTSLPRPSEAAIGGEVHFVRKMRQPEEFEYIVRSIGARLAAGEDAHQIMVLVPRKKLGEDFVEYANANKSRLGVDDSIDVAISSGPEFAVIEQERLLLLALLAHPASVVHIRSFLGLGDETWFAKEIDDLKKHYGGLPKIVELALPDDFPRGRKRIRRICERATELRNFLSQREAIIASVDDMIAWLFPPDDETVSDLRQLIVGLREPEDTVEVLYGKFVDYIRSIPEGENVVRVMTLMGSKGLEAKHVYIAGCNAGNIPGDNWSTHLNDLEYREEQRRLLYVGFTRARESLTVSWSRYIPFHQAMHHQTGSVAVRKFGGETYGQVALCQFLQDLSGVAWEH